MRRLKIVDKGRFITVITILLLLIMTCIYAVKAKEIKPIETEEYTVVYGDTLWSIGSKYCDNTTDIREWIYNVEKLNNCTAEIYAGETIKVIK